MRNVRAWSGDARLGFAGARLDVASSNSFDDILRDVSNANGGLIVAGYCAMLAFVVLSLARRDPSRSHAGVGLAGLVLVAVANAGALGVFSALGLSLNATILQVLPFIALGLGVDDMFLLVQVFREVPKPPGRPAHAIVGECFQRGGVSVTLTSLCNACGFFAGGLIPLPAVQNFCLSAGFVVVFNWAVLLFAFPALLWLLGWFG